MKAGKLRHRLEFQSPIMEARDSTGDSLDQYQSRFSMWGELSPLRGRTFFAAQQTNPEITGKVCIRYNEQTALIESSWRVVHAGHVYKLTTPTLNEDVRNRELEMFVAEMPSTNEVPLASSRN